MFHAGSSLANLYSPNRFQGQIIKCSCFQNNQLYSNLLQGRCCECVCRCCWQLGLLSLFDDLILTIRKAVPSGFVMDVT